MSKHSIPPPAAPSPPANKDARGIFLRPEPPAPVSSSPEALSPPSSDVDLDVLQDNIKLILQREIKTLMGASVQGLSRDQSARLVNCASLIAELKKAEGKALSRLTDAELEEMT